jgi:crotonobetainyl-CoA:carnitine CoA-transferase CaiB-like acyl-CoA transferase
MNSAPRVSSPEQYGRFIVARALEGVRVIDLTVWFQGPVSAQYLADFGAEVIKVERPQGGDQARGVRSIKSLEIGDWNQYFLVINRNKKSLVIDLRKARRQADHVPAGREVATCSCRTWRPSCSKAGACRTRSCAINPRLVYATNTGYGRFGGVSRPSFDMTVQALTGIMARLGEPGQPPIYLGMGSGDAYGGIMSALGIALRFISAIAPATGSASMPRSTVRSSISPRPVAGLSRRQQGERAAALAQGRWRIRCGTCIRRAASGSTSASAMKTARFAAACEALGQPRLALGSRFASAGAVRNNEALIEALDANAASTIHEPLLAALAERGASVASPINNLADVIRDEQAWQNDYFMKAWCEEVQREVDVRGLPVTLSKTPGEIDSPGAAARPGHRTADDGSAGYEWDEIEALQGEGRDSVIAEAGENNAVCNGGEHERDGTATVELDLAVRGLDDFKEIVYEKKHHRTLGGGVARVTLNKPDKMNTMTLATVDEMFRAFYDANHDPMIGVIVVAGEGQAFRRRRRCRVGALGAARSLLQPLSAQPPDAHVAQADHRAGAGLLHRRPQSHGVLLRFHDRGRQCRVRPGGPAGVLAGRRLLRALPDQGGRREEGARDVDAVPQVQGRQALQMGLVNTVVPLDQLEAEVDKWCEEMLAKSPGCLEVLKAAFDQEMDGYKEPASPRPRCIRTGSTCPKARRAAPPSSRSARRVLGYPPREAEMRRQLLEEYEALQQKGKGAGDQRGSHVGGHAQGQGLHRRHRRDGGTAASRARA